MNSKNSIQASNTLQAKHGGKPIILAEIVFGDPNEVGCKGVGICRFFPQKLRLNPQEMSVSARLVFLPGGSLHIHFRRSDLPEHLYSRQFAGKAFTIRTEVKWPRWIQKQLSARSCPRITPGVYSCQEYEKELVIRFYS